jgi:hypothetical protein
MPGQQSRLRQHTGVRESHDRRLDEGFSVRDPLVVIALRLLYTAAVMVVVIWLLRSGNPVGGLLLVPAAAVWLRREAESGRLALRVRQTFRH